MAHVAKYTRGQTGHLFDHYDRKKSGNPDINPKYSKMNYNLAPEHNQTSFLQERLKSVYCLKREDVNVMADWVITLPKQTEEQYEKDVNKAFMYGDFCAESEFFEKCYNFLANRYGVENVISSYVHMDETTPHMHFSFVPVIWDDKKQRLKVSAKEVLNKAELKAFHNDLNLYLKENNINRDVLNEATRDGNKTITELKRETNIAEQHRLAQKTEKIKQSVNTLVEEHNTLKSQNMALQEEIENQRLALGDLQKIRSFFETFLGRFKTKPIKQNGNISYVELVAARATKQKKVPGFTLDETLSLIENAELGLKALDKHEKSVHQKHGHLSH